MDWVTLSTGCMEYIRRYRYLFLVIIAGILLLRIPTDAPVERSSPQQEISSISSLEESLSRTLSQMEGAGRVEVLLTEAMGEELLFQEDKTQTSGEHSRDSRTDTVLISGSDRTESGLIRQRNPPVYRGALILCQGADRPGIRLAIVEAVADLTGLTTDKITVLTMK